MTTPQASQQVPEEVIENSWIHDHEMALPKYCANGSFLFFKMGFLAGMKYRDEQRNDAAIEALDLLSEDSSMRLACEIRDKYRLNWSYFRRKDG